MTKRERSKIDCLKRRHQFLVNRIDSNFNIDLSWDKREAAALQWAIEMLEDHLNK